VRGSFGVIGLARVLAESKDERPYEGTDWAGFIEDERHSGGWKDFLSLVVVVG
jgi:hypothetical protein